jgi:hypothetical protein
MKNNRGVHMMCVAHNQNKGLEPSNFLFSGWDFNTEVTFKSQSRVRGNRDVAMQKTGRSSCPGIVANYSACMPINPL